jgi:hypothetical protein
MTSLRELEPYINNALAVLVSRLFEVDTRRIDMAKWVQLFAFGIAFRLYSCFLPNPSSHPSSPTFGLFICLTQ